MGVGACVVRCFGLSPFFVFPKDIEETTSACSGRPAIWRSQNVSIHDAM